MNTILILGIILVAGGVVVYFVKSKKKAAPVKAKKVAKKLESGMRSFSPILRLDRFGDFYRTTSRYPSLTSMQSLSYASFHLKNNLYFF